MSDNTAIILAAGAGTRMKSKVPKVLHKVCGRAMLAHVVDQVKEIGIEDIIIIIGHGAEDIRKEFDQANVKFEIQEPLLGTGHAVVQGEKHIRKQGHTIVLCGDTPLITSKTLKTLLANHEKNNRAATILTANIDEPFGYGRILRDAGQNIIGIVEEKDANETEKQITEINSGIYCFENNFLKDNLKLINTDNAQKEYYLTDVIKIGVNQGKNIGGHKLSSDLEVSGVNTRIQLAAAEKAMRTRINENHMLNGVSFINPEETYIEADVKIGADTLIYPGVILTRGTEIGEDCMIGQNSRIENTKVGSHVEIQSSVAVDSKIGDFTTVGPYAYLRPKSDVRDHVKIGDFVEVKNAIMGSHSKASHLAYVGDTDVGENVNIGCGVVFVNYDGIHKFRSKIDDNAFIGSNANVVAPVHVGEGAYIAAGTTISRDVPPGALCVGRQKEKHIEGWVERKNLVRKKK